jgi:hypothetical protein
MSHLDLLDLETGRFIVIVTGAEQKLPIGDGLDDLNEWSRRRKDSLTAVDRPGEKYNNVLPLARVGVAKRDGSSNNALPRRRPNKTHRNNYNVQRHDNDPAC